MKYYWYKLHDGIGVVPVNEPDYFKIGKDVHEDMEAIAKMVDPPNEVVELVAGRLQALVGETDPLVLEPAYRHLGWLIAWGMWKEPQIRSAGWETEAIEHELVWERGGVQVSCIPDRILVNPSRGKRVYREYKTVKDASPGWIAYWQYAIQCHLGIAAYQEDTGLPINYAIVTGLKKGFEKDGKLRHPYVWAYSDGTRWSAEWKKDWILAPIWDYPGGLIEWVQTLGEDVGMGQFPESAPVFLDNRLLDNLVKSITTREGHYEEARQKGEVDPVAGAGVFEQRFTKCRPSFGSACPYIAACHNAAVGEDPLRSGIYKVRSPHHDLERIARGMGYE